MRETEMDVLLCRPKTSKIQKQVVVGEITKLKRNEMAITEARKNVKL